MSSLTLVLAAWAFLVNIGAFFLHVMHGNFIWAGVSILLSIMCGLGFVAEMNRKYKWIK